MGVHIVYLIVLKTKYHKYLFMIMGVHVVYLIVLKIMYHKYLFMTVGQTVLSHFNLVGTQKKNYCFKSVPTNNLENWYYST